MGRTMSQTWANYYQYMEDKETEITEEDFKLLEKQIKQIKEKLEGMILYYKQAGKSSNLFIEKVKSHSENISRIALNPES